ncbi:hypothetical protein HOM98_03905 [Candidatus Peregrinibacteria bacterium]|nr:hypothetical protein [Candidatus Peregrinibacteria bacterium]
MAGQNTPDADKSHDLTAEQAKMLEDMKAADKKAEAAANPDSTPERAEDIRMQTLSEVLEHEDSLTGRLGRSLKVIVPYADGAAPTRKGEIMDRIRKKGDALAEEMADKITEFGDGGRKRLHHVSLKTAEKLNRVTSRIKVAERVQNGVQIMEKEWKEEVTRVSEWTQALRGNLKKTNYVTGRVPEWMRDPGKLMGSVEKSTAKMMKTASLAAKQVLTEERAEHKGYQQAAKARFEPEQKAENAIRGIVAKYDPSLLAELDDCLNDSNGNGRAAQLEAIREKLIESDRFKAMPPPLRKSIEDAFEGSYGLLASEEYSRFKSFNAASQLELAGQPPIELMRRLKNLPLGEKVKLKLVAVDAFGEGVEYVIANKGSQNVALRRVDADDDDDNKIIFVDFQQKSVVVKTGSKSVADRSKPLVNKKYPRKFVDIHQSFGFKDRENVSLALAS